MKRVDNLREIKKTGVLDNKKFYQDISKRCNYISEDAVKEFYLALVRTVTAGLRENGIIRLPYLGDMALVRQKDKMGLSGNKKMFIEGAHMLKFYPDYALKGYFSELSKSAQRKLDPSEKLLGKKS
jgi:nucleoid DNA-binding protein